MGKEDKLKKRYLIGCIAVIIFQILLMQNVLSEKDQLPNKVIVEEHKNESIVSNNILAHPKESGMDAKHITLIGIGLIGTGSLLMIIEERKKKETKKPIFLKKICKKYRY